MTGVEVITFGCRLNAAESDVIRRAAGDAGLGNAVVVNTCAVTAEAERQARQAIRRARREHPQAHIIVTGCAATLAPERYAALAEVDLVLDNAAKLRAKSYATALESPTSPHPSPPPNGPRGAEREFQQRPGIPSPPFRGERERPMPHGSARSAARGQAPAWEGEVGPDSRIGRVRGYLQVQQGCDHRCTFCIIPYARGPSRSLPFDAVLAEARRLIAGGCREIVLTGVDLTAYGADLADWPSLGRPSLGQLVRRLLAALPELARLRLSSLDPAEIDAELWALLGDEPRLMPHLHLSLQSGDDLILKRMKRRHSRAQAIAAAQRARALRPEVALGADLIDGFPTESEAMFGRSLDLVGEAGIAFLHVFPYSPRPGTPAARMPQLDPAVVRERAARLRAAGAAALGQELARRVGREEDVLVERPGLGRADCYAAVRCFDGAAEIGAVRRMRFVACSSGGRELVGVPVT
jgi:threonylcarbamoyladenosine tRNA methylthiotransferase MtaB